MAKQRNSLGVLVLPTPHGTMTWEQYKEAYGIDLNEIFDWSEDVGSIFIKSSFSKFIALDWRPLLNHYGYTFIERAPIELIVGLLLQGLVSGDDDEKIYIATNVVSFTIDAKNKTVDGEEV